MYQKSDLECRSMIDEDARAVLSTHLLAEGMLQMSQEPAVVLDLDLRVKIANRAFYDTFRLTPACAEKGLIDELYFARWNATRFRNHLGKVLCENTQLEELPFEFDIRDLGSRIFLAKARKINGEDRAPQAILLELKDLTRQECQGEGSKPKGSSRIGQAPGSRAS